MPTLTAPDGTLLVYDMYEAAAPLLLYNRPLGTHYLSIRLKSGAHLQEALTKVSAVLKANNPEYPVDLQSINDDLNQLFNTETLTGKLAGIFATLAIFISCLGLYGLVSFMALQKTKEVGIRKVLGASEWILILLLSRGFLFLLTLASLVAIPATYLFFNNVVLNNFAYHVPIGVTELLAGVMAVMVIAIAMIGSQTLKVARSNPAEVLKNE